MLVAVDREGRVVARLKLVEGATRGDAELFVARGEVPGAVRVAEAMPNTRLVGAFQRLMGCTREIAEIAARGRGPDAPTVHVPRQQPRLLQEPQQSAMGVLVPLIEGWRR